MQECSDKEPHSESQSEPRTIWRQPQQQLEGTQGTGWPRNNWDYFSTKHAIPSFFWDTWKSFEVDSKLRKAQDLAIRYGISGVPAVVVNGKYRTGASEHVRGYPQVLEVVDERVARESS